VKLYSPGRIGGALTHPVVAKVTTAGVPADEDRNDFVLLWRETVSPSDTSGYAAILTPRRAPSWESLSPLVHSTIEFEYLSGGDVVYVHPSGFVTTLYRKGSPHNFILVTDQCNSFCLMCSQPPRQVDDFDRIREHLRLIDLIDPETREIGITGGEPTLFKDDFLRLIEHCKNRLPNTALHVLTNGRMFYNREFARRLGLLNIPTSCWASLSTLTLTPSTTT